MQIGKTGILVAPSRMKPSTRIRYRLLITNISNVQPDILKVDFVSLVRTDVFQIMTTNILPLLLLLINDTEERPQPRL